MNRCTCLLIAPLLASSGVVFAQPTWDEGESFDDFREEWNGWISAVPEDQKYGEEAQQLHRELYELQTDPVQFWLRDVLELAAPGNEYWEYADEIFVKHRSYFDRAYKLAGRTYIGTEFAEPDGNTSPRDMMEAFSSDSTDSARQLGDMLNAHARYLAFTGDTDGAMARLQALARLDTPDDFLNSQLWYIASGEQRVLRATILELLYSYEQVKFTDEQLAELQALISAQRPLSAKQAIEIQNRVEYENWRENYVQGEYDIDFQIDYAEAVQLTHAVFEPKPYRLPEPSDVPSVPFSSPDDQYACVDAILQAFAKDLDHRSLMRDELYIDQAYEQFFGTQDGIDRYAIAYTSSRLWRFFFVLSLRERAADHNLQVAIALHRHRVRHGTWPATLDDIDPEVLTVRPVDFFTHESLGYEILRDEPFLWALGPDRDDDGGKVVGFHDDDFRGTFEISIWLTEREFESLTEQQRKQIDGDVLIYTPDIWSVD